MAFAWEIALGIAVLKKNLMFIKNRWEANLFKIIQKILALDLSIPQFQNFITTNSLIVQWCLKVKWFLTFVDIAYDCKSLLELDQF